MKKLFVLSFLISFALLIVSCSEDDNTVAPTPTPTDGLVGVWLSTGSNVAPLLNTIFAAAGGVD